MRLVLGALLGAAGAFAISRRSPSGHRPPQPRYPGDQQSGATAGSGDRHDGDQPQRAAAQKRPAKPQKTSEERHQRRECWYWIVTGLMSILATGATGFAAWFAWGAYLATREQVHIAQDALVAADRPWLKVVGFSEPAVDVDDIAVWARLTVHAENIGPSPAPLAFLRGKLIPYPSFSDETDEALALCRDATDRQRRWWENRIVFPGDKDGFTETWPSERRAIRDKREAMLRLDRAIAGRIMSDEEADARLRQRAAAPPYVHFSVVGCFTYALPNGRTVGQTTFAVKIRRACEDGPIEGCDFDAGREAIYRGDDLRLRENPSATFAR